MNTCTTEIKGDLFILHLPDSWKKETNNLFTLETPGLLEQITQSTFVIDFTKVVIFDVSSISGLISVIRTLQKSNKNVICTNAGPFIQKKS